jgi:hypothetical protein
MKGLAGGCSIHPGIGTMSVTEYPGRTNFSPSRLSSLVDKDWSLAGARKQEPLPSLRLSLEAGVCCLELGQFL